MRIMGFGWRGRNRERKADYGVMEKMERAMGIEPTRDVQKLLNILVPFIDSESNCVQLQRI